MHSPQYTCCFCNAKRFVWAFAVDRQLARIWHFNNFDMSHGERCACEPTISLKPALITHFKSRHGHNDVSFNNCLLLWWIKNVEEILDMKSFKNGTFFNFIGRDIFFVDFNRIFFNCFYHLNEKPPQTQWGVHYFGTESVIRMTQWKV